MAGESKAFKRRLVALYQEYHRSRSAAIARSRAREGTHAAGLDAFEAEIEDRFGALPADAHRLVSMARLKRLARELGIERVDAGPSAIAFTMRSGRRLPAALATLVEEKGDRWLLREGIDLADDRLARIQTLLEDAFDDETRERS